ncbi:MAG: NAD(P)-binding protein, partial [Lachnospiraceae bacterium]|nr:NAD(P)-binding protein [Lachnospiraceae bacterium]
MSQANKEKIIIIGGGIAGLSAGIYALKEGFDAEIYEKNPIVGGECMGWNRKGYHIDNCIHWLTGTDPKTGLWQVWKTVGAIDENTEYADTSKFYSSRFEGREVTLWNDLDKTQEELIAESPEDEEEIRKFIEYVRYAEECVIPSIKPLDMMGIKDYIEMGKGM